MESASCILRAHFPVENTRPNTTAGVACGLSGASSRPRSRYPPSMIRTSSVGTTYPVSAKPDALVSRDDILRRIYRDYYEGTDYDLSSGIAAGPFGSPVRFKPGPGARKVAGECGTLDDVGPCNRWERPIAVFRTTMIYVTSIPKNEYENATMWFLPGAALGGVFVPIMFSARAVPAALSDCSNILFDRSKAMWAFRELVQFAYPRWSHVKDAIRAAQADLEDAGGRISASIRAGSPPEIVASAIEDHATSVVSRWQGLYGELLVRYSDNWDYSLSGGAKRLGYPAEWLRQVGFLNGPPSCKSLAYEVENEKCGDARQSCADAASCRTSMSNLRRPLD